MCGICGIFQFDPQRPVSRETLRRMTDSLSHRGPDDAGYHFGQGIGLGHRRLSIIDLDSGQQPLCNEDGSVWVVFNGEIYNYPYLRSLLESKGHKFRTNSDTETIVHLYEEFGGECFARMHGMFAVAIWDQKKRQLLLARDRIGKKPLFYAFDGQRVVFGSELKSVMLAGDVPDDVDSAALADYFCFLYIPSPQTIYRKVRKVRPAHYLLFNEHGMQERCYWDLHFIPDEEREEARWCEQLRESLLDAVQKRLMSEVPLGSFLSGGIDSSAVVACMARLMQRAVTTCAINFEEERFSEVEHAREMARHIGADYHEATVRPEATKIVEQLAWHYDEPFADSSAIPTYYVCKAAREHVTVALSGDGGDESFAGYKRYRYFAAENRLREFFPSGVRSGVFAPLARVYPDWTGAPRVFRAKTMLRTLASDPLESYLASVTISPAVRDGLLASSFREDLDGYDPLEQFREHYRRAEGADPLSRIQYLDIKTYLTDDICTKVDRASMAVSLEVRAPLLDHSLMELAARIPSRLKLRGGAGKYIFKKSVQEMLPRSILQRGKQGFGVPIAEWFRGELREWGEAVLFQQDDVLDAGSIRRIWDRHQAGIQDHSALLWAVFVFRQWQSCFQKRLAVAACVRDGR